MKRIIIGIVVVAAILGGCAKQDEPKSNLELWNEELQTEVETGELSEAEFQVQMMIAESINTLYEADNEGNTELATLLASKFVDYGWYFDRYTQEFYLQDIQGNGDTFHRWR